MIHDISHCNNDNCNVKEKCYRWLAYQEIKKINYIGSFSMIQGKDTDCPYFMSKD